MSRTPWWRDAVCYEVYLRSFADGNGDGVGDLPGARSRLAYLRDLGVDAVWLTPFYPSPMADHGYDVADYRGVDPVFGSLADVDALLSEAHRLGLRVIIDLVPNHTSSSHPWFRAALAAGPGSPERARYVFRPGRGTDGALPPNNWGSRFGGPAWQRVTEPDGRPGEWYLHLFAPEQPDLNWRNPEVHAEFEAILAFWLDRGVDGFRVDVAHGLVKQESLPDAPSGDADLGMPGLGNPLPMWNQPETHDVYRSWRRILDSYPGDRMAIGEAWVEQPDDLAFYVRADELHQAFNFAFLQAPWSARAFRDVIDASLGAMSRVDAVATWVLSDHDVRRQVTRYGGGAVGLRRARAALLLMLALPGSVYLYQGEELGLPEVTDLPEEVLQDPTWERSGHTRRGRDGCRVPIPWSGTHPPYGFVLDGSGGADTWLPMPQGWDSLCVTAQEHDPGSTLALYRRALRLRREHPALGNGAPSFRPPDGGPIPDRRLVPTPLAGGPPPTALRWLDAPPDVLLLAREPGFACVLNCGEAPVPIPEHTEVLLGSDPLGEGVLPGGTAAWLRT